MHKLRYDPNQPDASALRQAVFAKLRAGWFVVERADYDGQLIAQAFEQVVDFVQPLPPHWESAFMAAVFDLLWQLVAEGVIRPGGQSGLNFPQIGLTDYGRRILLSETAHPHDIDRFLDQMRSGQDVDPTVEAYLVESLYSFRQNRLVASAVLLGIAAERTFLVISEALLRALANPKEREALQKLLLQQPMKPKQDWVHKKLVELDGRRPRLEGYPESTAMIVTGIYDLIRQQRNDLGHPRDTPPRVERSRLEANLILFSNFHRAAEQLRSYFATRNASI
jgi:hypothetical protein